MSKHSLEILKEIQRNQTFESIRFNNKQMTDELIRDSLQDFFPKLMDQSKRDDFPLFLKLLKNEEFYVKLRTMINTHLELINKYNQIEARHAQMGKISDANEQSTHEPSKKLTRAALAKRNQQTQQQLRKDQIYVRLVPHNQSSCHWMLCHRNFPRIECKLSCNQHLQYLVNYLTSKWLRGKVGYKVVLYPDGHSYLKSGPGSANQRQKVLNEPLNNYFMFTDIMAGSGVGQNGTMGLQYDIVEIKKQYNSRNGGGQSTPQKGQQNGKHPSATIATGQHLKSGHEQGGQQNSKNTNHNHINPISSSGMKSKQHHHHQNGHNHNQNHNLKQQQSPPDVAISLDHDNKKQQLKSSSKQPSSSFMQQENGNNALNLNNPSNKQNNINQQNNSKQHQFPISSLGPSQNPQHQPSSSFNNRHSSLMINPQNQQNSNNFLVNNQSNLLNSKLYQDDDSVFKSIGFYGIGGGNSLGLSQGYDPRKPDQNQNINIMSIDSSESSQVRILKKNALQGRGNHEHNNKNKKQRQSNPTKKEETIILQGNSASKQGGNASKSINLLQRSQEKKQNIIIGNKSTGGQKIDDLRNAISLMEKVEGFVEQDIDNAVGQNQNTNNIKVEQISQKSEINQHMVAKQVKTVSIKKKV